MRRAGLRRAITYLQFGLAGLAMCVLVWWPLLQADQSWAAGGGGGGAPTAVDSARAQATHEASIASRPHGASGGQSTWVRIAGDAPLGLPGNAEARTATASASDLRHELTVTVVLKRTDQAGFNHYLQQVTDRHSAQYRHYSTPVQQAERYGPAASAYSAVKSWLLMSGLRVTQTTANRLSITARGSESQAQRAFNTPIVTFKGGREPVYGNTEAPAVPGPIARDIEAVTGLSDRNQPVAAPEHITDPATLFSGCAGVALGTVALFDVSAAAGSLAAALVEAMLFSIAFLALATTVLVAVSVIALLAECGALTATSTSPPPPPSSPPSPPPCVPAPGEPCVLIAPDRPGRAERSETRAGRSADRVGQAADPTQKLGLLEFDTYHSSDVTDWLNLVGSDPAPAGRLSEVNVNGGVAAPGAGESEVLLDIDTVLSVAPNAPTSYVVYDAPPSTSFVQMFQSMIAGGDTVIANSWSQCEDQTPLADAQAIDSVLSSAAASGVTVLNGSGDAGSTCLDGSPSTIGVPADSPNATAVGGTTPTLGPGVTYQHESWWNDQGSNPPGGAGGFGVSHYFPRPSYQSGLSSSSKRSVPDLSFNAAPKFGMELCQADSGGCPNGLLSGGTSMAAPAVAAEVVDLNSALGRNVGDLNSAVYPLAGTAAFHTPQSMASDFAHVGLGSPKFSPIYQKLAGVPTSAVNPSQSLAAGIGQPQSDGSQQGIVRVDLKDKNGFPVGGKAVTVTPTAGVGAVVSPSSAVTDATDGSAVFTVTDSSSETATFTVKDATDNVTLTVQPTLTFVPPVATGASIEANESTVPDDGTSSATILVYLENGLGQPAAGKTVMLSQTGSATIAPAGSSTLGNTAVTGTNGYADFTVTDTTAESVQFTAAETSDGNLPVPGSASVTFFSGSPPTCPNSPVPASGYGFETFASPFAFDPYSQGLPGSFTLGACAGVSNPVFDSSGNALLPDYYAGTINKLPAGGGTAGSDNQLPNANFGRDDIHGLVFGKDGELYASLDLPLPSGVNNNQDPEIVQLDPSTGAILRVLATAAEGLPDCPGTPAIDPVSGDLFVGDTCSGYLGGDAVTRIEHPSASNPTMVHYATLSGLVEQLAFAPDGTLYAVDNYKEIDQISGTNSGTPGTVTSLIDNYTPGFGLGLAVTGGGAGGAATQLTADDLEGNVYTIDLTADPAVVTNAAAPGGSGGAFGYETVGPDGCLYLAAVSEVDRFGRGSCGNSGSAATAPGITLQETSGSTAPGTGSSVGFTARLANVSTPSGTPIHFEITGPNLSGRLANANAAGQASTSYSGVFQGVDTVTASAVVHGTTITSAPVEVHWTAGKHITFLDLNATREGGQVGRSATVTASLWDETQSPLSPIAGQPVTLGLGDTTCAATTNSSGVASCKLTPKTVGLLNATASYAGSSQYAASTATNEFDSVTDSPAVDVTLPKISGKAKAKSKLTCSPGTWSNGPYGYTYRWNRNGTAIQKAAGTTYKVQALDEGSTLTCSVVALNIAGKSGPATSHGVKVAVPRVKGCPAATGKIAGAKIGSLRLGMTRSQAHAVYRRSSSRGFKYKTFFCLTPEGVRVGYGSPILLKSLPRKLRGKYSGKVVWASTSNPIYAIKGVRAGATLAAARRHLKVGKPIKIGLNDWYLAPAGTSTAVLKVRHGLVQEIGIADKALTRTRKAQRTLMSSFD
jgi:hypothetical protein